MRFAYLRLLLCFPTSVCLHSEVKFMNDSQAIDVAQTDLSSLSSAISIDNIIIGIFICLLVYLLAEYNAQLLFREKFSLAINMLHKTHTPLALLRNQLEDVMSGNLPEPASRKLKKALECTDFIMDCNCNAIALDKANKKAMAEASTVEFELYTYIISIVNRCRPYANSRQIELKVCESSDYVHCRINEAVMTAALQHLLDKMIEVTPSNCCINISVSHDVGSWKLCITNNEDAGSVVERTIPLIPVMFPIHAYIDLWTVRKIIRSHGGKIAGYGHSKALTFQVVIPTNCLCQDKVGSGMNFPEAKEKTHLSPEKQIHNNEIQNPQAGANPYILLVMADRQFSDYLEEALAEYFQISVIDNPDLVINTSVRQKPDAIIIDETINGVYGDELCSRIKADKVMMNIPVVLLVRATDNESYLSHVESGADRLELRMVNTCRLRADINMLIGSYKVLREQVRQFLASAVSSIAPAPIEEKDDNQEFVDKLQEVLEKNLATEGYTIDMLCVDLGMCRTKLYNKIRNIAGTTPQDYMFSFKMDRAKGLLLSQQYSITEIATMLGYCDAKYFGKRFKEFYHVSPSKYADSIID